MQAANVERGGLRIRKYKIGDLVLRKHVPTYADTFGKCVWTGPHEVIQVCNTNHTVRLWLNVGGRPTKHGAKLGLEWTHTSNVKPCRLDKDGRLLSVRMQEEGDIDFDENLINPDNEELIHFLNETEIGRDIAIQVPTVSSCEQKHEVELPAEAPELPCCIYTYVADVPQEMFEVVTTRTVDEFDAFLSVTEWSSVVEPGNLGPTLPPGAMEICDAIMNEELVIRLDTPEPSQMAEGVLPC